MHEYKKILSLIDNYRLLLDERKSVGTVILLKNLESLLIDIVEFLDYTDKPKIENDDHEAIAYHSKSIELIVAKLDEEDESPEVAMWKVIYLDLLAVLNFDEEAGELSEENDVLMNIADTIATLYVKFHFLKKDHSNNIPLLIWILKYGYETDWGEDIQYLLEFFPGIRSQLLAG